MLLASHNCNSKDYTELYGLRMAYVRYALSLWHCIASGLGTGTGFQSSSINVLNPKPVAGRVLSATSSPSHLMVFSTLPCLLSSSSSLPPLLPSSHLSEHSPPISALASLVSSCPPHVTLPLSSVVCHPPSFLRVLPTVVCSSPVSLSSSSALLFALATLAIFRIQLCSHTCSLCCCRSVIAKVSVPNRHADVTSYMCSWHCPFLSFWDPPVRHHPSTTLHVFAPACALRRRPRLHLSPSSRLRTMPFLDRGLQKTILLSQFLPLQLDVQLFRGSLLSGGICAALPSITRRNSVAMMLLSIRMTALNKVVVTTLIAHHGTTRLCTACCKHALICCGMS